MRIASSRGFWLVLGFWLLLLVPFVAKLAPTAFDDAFITYRFAENLAFGEGLVFNPGERVFGLTEPGLGLLLGWLHLVLGVALPWLGALTTAAGLLALALLLGRPRMEEGRGTGAILAGTLLVSSTYLWQSRGTAAPLVLALLVLASRTDRDGLRGAAAGLAVWCRPDAALGASLLAMMKWRGTRSLPWRFGIGVGSVLAVGLLLTTGYYGTPIPITLAAKQAAAQWAPEVWPAGPRFWLGFWDLFKVHHGALSWPLLLFGVCGQPSLWRWGPEGRIVSLYSMGLLVAYPLLDVAFFPWYGTPIVIALLYGAVAFLEEITQSVGSAARAADPAADHATHQPWIRRTGLVVLAVLILGLEARSLLLLRRYEEPSHLTAYRQAGEWLRQNTPQDARVTCLEVGVLGYTSRRPVQDLMGLVTPRFIEAIAEGDLDETLRQHPTEFVVDHSARRVSRFTAEDWFQQRYSEVVRFPDRKGGSVAIFRHDG